jgi:UDP:flavonoid glycosyltransferase YjiC (YdhE family)
MAAANMRETAERIMRDGSYRFKAAELGVGLKKAGGVKTAVDQLEKEMERFS